LAKKKRSKAKTKLTPEQRRRRRERAMTEAARNDVHDQPSGPAWGTSPASLGVVKAASEEARLLTCPECGRAAGRHSKLCTRLP
jgi:hypothetical protein